MTHPLPKKRSQISVTVSGGFQFACPCGGTGWRSDRPKRPHLCVYEPAGDGRKCLAPILPSDYVARPDRQITGWVVDVAKANAPGGDNLVYVSPTNSRRDAECLVWSQVKGVSVV